MKTLAQLADLESDVINLAAQIGADHKKDIRYAYVGIPTLSPAGVYVEVKEDEYHFVDLSDHGKETGRLTTKSKDDMLYLVLNAISKGSAYRYALMHRIATEDPRRQYFKLWVKKMTQLSPDWGKRTQKEVDGILEQSPYKDHDFKANM